ncbi:MAG TPA: haloalkane dehalogenase [Acidimicrobiales bacterium]
MPDVVRTPDERFAALPDWPFAPHYVDVHGVRMHYVDEGPRDADVFLLVHGEPTWSYLYRRWIPRLVDAGFRVVAPDHIGFGRSDKVTDDGWYVIDRHVEAQRALIDALDLSRIHLFCQDWGGPISLRNACDEPDRYARLFVGNTWLHHEGYAYTDAIRGWREMAVDPERLGGDMPTGLIVSVTLRRTGHDTEAVQAAYDAPFTGGGSKAGARRFPWCLPFARPLEGGAAWQQECFERLRSWSGPVHFVWGDADEIFTWESAQEWAAVVPGATLDRIAGAGHFLQEDAPGDCVDAVLQRAGSGSGA